MKPGPRNLITDVPGLRVGNVGDHRIKTGVTVLTGDKAFGASVDVMGGAPGSRDTEVLAPDKLVDAIDALVLSGGSVFGLDAASGVTDALQAKGRGFRYGSFTVPIAPSAILFDLGNGGDKTWTDNPYRALGAAALEAAVADFALGTSGAGVGAQSAGYKGGLGSASLVLSSGFTVGALTAANPTGSVVIPDSQHFWAAPFEVDGEFGGRGIHPGPISMAGSAKTRREVEMNAMGATTLAIVATDAALSKAQLKRLAVAAQDGIARAISPAHTIVDGDIVFAVSTGTRPLTNPVLDLIYLGHAAAVCLSRAIARAVYEATPAPNDLQPTWRETWPESGRNV